MNREKEIKVIKVIKKTDRIQESCRFHELDGDTEVRIEMARELHEMGLKTESIERILSIRITSGK